MDESFYKKLTSLSEISKNQLSRILNFCPEIKDLILEPDVIRPLERICGVKWLKGNGIDKIYKLGSAVPAVAENVQYYMIYTNFETLKLVIELIKPQVGFENRPSNKFHIVCIPTSPYMFEQYLEEQGLLDTIVKLYSLQWQPVHIDRGILSLELPHMFKNLYVNQDLTLLKTYSKSLWYLYFVVGKPNFTIALGQHSVNVLKQLDVLSEDVADTDKYDCDFGALVLIDRTVDYPSALLTPLTYTGLLKEIFTIKCGVCEHKANDMEKYDNKFNVVPQKNALMINLDSKRDSIYHEIKNLFFTKVTSVLSSLTKQLRTERDTSKEMALDEIKKYVQTQLQAATSKKKHLTTHLNAAETIINIMGARFERQQEVEQNILFNRNKTGNYTYLEESLFENDPLLSLRLLCLLCATQKLSDGDVKKFLSKFYQEFGYNYGYLYNNLIKLGLLDTQQMNLQTKIINIPKMLTNNFYVNANKLKQMPNEPDKIELKSPTCTSYVFGGCYIPLVTKILSFLLGGTPLKEIESKLESFGPLLIQNKDAYPLRSRSVLLYVIGGFTYAEVAACNLLEVLTGSQITVISDQMISGHDIAESLLHSATP